ncbi:MAG: formylglycine-generating enzyme family protein [Verrucomicrobiales bacterium]|nr:formylglycine-generating enzyme family protein [Verrucomicrobiales bacterium]
MCRIPAGRFQMSDAKIDVTITKDFWIGKYEVTQKEYEEIMGANPAKFKQAGNMAPVETVSWLDAMEFCRKLTEREQQNGTLPEGWIYHLPTEAQWDYASRAGSKTAYSFGDDRSRLGEFAWFEDNGGGMTHSVGRKKPNEWGLHDVHGNVWEWCRDWFGDLSGGKDPEGAASGTFRVTRGGCWKNNAAFCRSVSRNWTPPAERNNILGFRVALVPSGTVAGSSDQ